MSIKTIKKENSFDSSKLSMNELVVLSLLECYTILTGSKMISSLNDSKSTLAINEGSIYNILKAMVKKGLICYYTTKTESKKGGNDLKVYFMTDKGRSLYFKTTKSLLSIWINVP